MVDLSSNKNINTNTVSKKEVYKKIVAITNRNLCDGDFFSQIELICKRGVSSIILREKDMTEKEYEELAVRVIDIGKEYNIPVILHSFINVAQRLENMAIHLSMLDFIKFKDKQSNFHENTNKSFRIIGVSIHTLEEALEAQRAGASYITASHIYATECKKGLEPKGISFLSEICQAVSIPVYALGGINFNNMDNALEAGAEKVCMMSEMMKIK